MAEFATILSWAKNDRRPFFNMHLFEGESNVIHDITGVGNIKFFMRLKGASTNKVDGVAGAILGPGTDGVLEYQWGATDLDTVNTKAAPFYEAWFTYEPAASRTETTTRVEIVVAEPWDRNS